MKSVSMEMQEKQIKSISEHHLPQNRLFKMKLSKKTVKDIFKDHFDSDNQPRQN
jgi:hypothetical protein